MAIEIVVQPSFPSIIVSDNPGNVSPDLSNYVTYPYLVAISGQLKSDIDSNDILTIKSGDLIGEGSVTIYYNGNKFVVSGLNGGGGSGIQSLNSLDGSINLISTTDYLSFANVGNNIDINQKPQNTIIYRNISGQITGVQKNIEFVSIYRNINNQITGVYYGNYYKKILFDNQDNITGVNIVYI